MTDLPDDSLESAVQADADKAALIAELQQRGIKHSPEKILRIAKLPDGKIIFLEEGRGGQRGSGLRHILEKHQKDFANRGIAAEQIADTVINAVLSGRLVGYQGTQAPLRTIYEIIVNGETQYIAVSVSENGYIVGANPATYP